MSLRTRALQANEKPIPDQLKEDITRHELITNLRNKSILEKLQYLNEHNEFIQYHLDKLNIKLTPRKIHYILLYRLANLYPYIEDKLSKELIALWNYEVIPSSSNSSNKCLGYVLSWEKFELADKLIIDDNYNNIWKYITNTGAIQYLSTKEFDIPNWWYANIFEELASQSNFNALQKLEIYIPDNQKQECFKSAINGAIKDGPHLSIIKYYIEKMEDMSSTTLSTAIKLAITGNFPQVVEYFIDTLEWTRLDQIFMYSINTNNHKLLQKIEKIENPPFDKAILVKMAISVNNKEITCYLLNKYQTDINEIDLSYCFENILKSPKLKENKEVIELISQIATTGTHALNFFLDILARQPTMDIEILDCVIEKANAFEITYELNGPVNLPQVKYIIDKGVMIIFGYPIKKEVIEYLFNKSLIDLQRLNGILLGMGGFDTSAETFQLLIDLGANEIERAFENIFNDYINTSPNENIKEETKKKLEILINAGYEPYAYQLDKLKN